MKRTISRLASSVIDLASSIGIEAEHLADDPGISGAEAACHLRDAQACCRAATDAIRLALTQRTDAKPDDQGERLFDSDFDAA